MADLGRGAEPARSIGLAPDPLFFRPTAAINSLGDVSTLSSRQLQRPIDVLKTWVLVSGRVADWVRF